MGILAEFNEFLREYKVIGLAVAFVMGGAITTLVQALVAQVIMPMIALGLPSGDWQTATAYVWGAKIGWGAFLSALINFVIIAFVIFLIVRAIEGKKGKKK